MQWVDHGRLNQSLVLALQLLAVILNHAQAEDAQLNKSKKD